MFTQINVQGDDARSFLQGQLTQDLAIVSGTCSPLAAWCTPKGRVIALLRLLETPTGIGMVLLAELADKVVTDMQRYRLRAKAEFTLSDSNWTAAAIDNGPDLARLESAGLLPGRQPGSSRQDTAVTAVCLHPAEPVIELYGDTASLGLQQPLDDSAWQAARIRAGIADITADNSEKFTPHMLNLDRIGAVSFNKGCYAGQEIVARTQHLGNAKRRVASFQADSAVPAGNVVQDHSGNDVGEVVAAAGRLLLVLLPLALHGSELAVDGVRLAPS